MIRSVSQALIVIFLVFINPGKLLYADCVGGVSVWPDSEEITADPIILLEGYMNMKAAILEIGGKNRLFLESSGGKQIELKIQQKWESGFKMAQVLFKTGESLIAGDTYTLRIEGLSDTDKALFVFSGKEGNWGPKTWVVKQKEVGKAIFNARPSFKSSMFRNRGGSEEIFALFSININPGNLLVVELWEKKNKKIKSIFYVPSNSSGEIRIGKGMCYGSYNLKPEEKYIIKFKTLDVSGKAGSVSSNLKFKTTCTTQ